MSEKRFVLAYEKGNEAIFEDREYFYPKRMTNKEVERKLNEQQATINELDQENADLLGSRIRAQEEWEKCTDKLKKKILEQQDTISALKEENEQLKNELRKEKSLREYSDSMYGADLIVNIRFSKGEWKADVSVIDDE